MIKGHTHEFSAMSQLSLLMLCMLSVRKTAAAGLALARQQATDVRPTICNCLSQGKQRLCSPWPGYPTDCAYLHPIREGAAGAGRACPVHVHGVARAGGLVAEPRRRHHRRKVVLVADARVRLAAGQLARAASRSGVNFVDAARCC